MGIKTKTIFLIGLVLFISFASLGYFNYKTSEGFITNRIMNVDLPMRSDIIKNNIELKILPKINLVSTMANNEFLKQWYKDGEKDITAIKKYMGSIQKEYDVFVASTSSNITQTQYTRDGIFTKLSKNDPFNAWFYSFIDSGKKMILNITVDELRDFKLVAFINHIMKDKDDKILGLSTIGLDMNDVSKYVLQYVNNNRNIYIINKAGYVIVHKNRNMIYVLENEQKNKSRNIKYMSGIDSMADKVLTSNDKFIGEYINKFGKDIVFISNYIPSIDSYLIIEENKDLLFDEIHSMFMKKLIAALIATIVVLMLLVFILNKMVFKKED